MYESYFGLTGKPFSLLPEANYLYFSERHQHIVNLLEYGMETQAAFIVVTGDVGAGKTSIIRHFLSHLPEMVTVGLITNPSKRLGSLLNWVSSAFDLDQHNNDEAKMYHGFVEFLLAQYAKGLRTILIIDEAQNLTTEILEELRMLSNVNNEQDILLQIILVGQPELLDTLNTTELRQFVQRIGVHGHLTALSPAETAHYIRHRLTVFGGNADIFDNYACAAVHLFTGGVPRLINLLCDQAMMYAFAEDQPVVNFQVIAEVVTDRNNTGLTSFRASVESHAEATLLAKLQEILADIVAQK
jgi:general secretion pathway protein A